MKVQIFKMGIRNQKIVPVAVVANPADKEGPSEGLVLSRMDGRGPALPGVGTATVGVVRRVDVSESPLEGSVGACRT
jgi:hypothetical protein